VARSILAGFQNQIYVMQIHKKNLREKMVVLYGGESWERQET